MNRRSHESQPPVLHQPAVQSLTNDPSPSIAPSEVQRPIVRIRQIGDVSLTALAVEEVLQQYVLYYDNCRWRTLLTDSFFAVYHPSFPVIADQDEFLKSWDRNEFLLWSVVAIASKSMDAYTHVHSLLQPHVRRMASDIYSLDSDPLRNVLALLLLCWWPFVYAATKDDPSWAYCALAGHIALKHGFHRPGRNSDYVYDSTLDAQNMQLYHRAWAGCCIVNQS